MHCNFVAGWLQCIIGNLQQHMQHYGERCRTSPSHQDPFYQPSATFWQKTAPGTILKSRKVTIGPLTGTPTPLQAAYQLLYRTTDASANPSTAVTTILIPHNANFSRLLSYQAAYDSADNNCSPSYGLQYGGSTHAASTTVELSQVFIILLTQGWCMSVPD